MEDFRRTLKLNTTDDTHIAHGPGKSNLLMNGGTLDMNGKNETINGLSGATGTVTDGLVTTTSTLTVGAGDASASFGGTIQNGLGTVALTKIGTGIQTLTGSSPFTGATTIEGGSLVMGGTMADSPVTVKSGAKLVVSAPGKDLQALTLEASSSFSAPLDTIGSNYLAVDDALTFSGGTVTLLPTFTEAPALGTYDFIVPTTPPIAGSATLIADFSANGATRVGGSAQIVGDIVSVTVATLGANLTWNNAAATGIWDLDTASNFLNGASNDVFKQYDHVTFDATSPAGTVTLNGTLLPATVTVDSANNFTFAGSGAIAGFATLTKNGGGTLTVATTNTFSGITTVSGGTLAVNGSLGTSAVSVDSGATLAGSGTLAGPVTVNGSIAPGASVGTLATGALTLPGTYQCDIDGPQSDKIAVTGNLDLTDSSLAVNFINPPTGVNRVIASYTGSRTGTFAAAPAGYELDYTDPGKVVLWPAAVAPPTGTVTFEVDQSYPTAPGGIAATNGVPTDAPYDGANGWSLSTSNTASQAHATNSSGEYRGGQAIGAIDINTYIGAKLGVIQATGQNTITFDAPYFTGTGVGFMNDNDDDGLWDQGSTTVPGDSGMAFGIGGSPVRFQYRNANFGAENFGAGFTGTAGHWYRFNITIGNSGSGTGGTGRSITMAVRNLTTGVDYDFDSVTAGTQNWTFSVTEAQFGTAPELSDGVFVRTTSSARIDNLRVTSVSPLPPATAYDTWMDLFPVLDGDDTLPDADPDHDGIKNLLEFLLDGNPTQSDASILSQQSIVGDDLRLTFRRRDDSEAFASLQLQVGVNLATWPTTATIGAGDGSSGDISWTVTPDGANLDLITITIPKGVDPAKFVRLKAETLAP